MSDGQLLAPRTLGGSGGGAVAGTGRQPARCRTTPTVAPESALRHPAVSLCLVASPRAPRLSWLMAETRWPIVTVLPIPAAFPVPGAGDRESLHPDPGRRRHHREERGAHQAAGAVCRGLHQGKATPPAPCPHVLLLVPGCSDSVRTESGTGSVTSRTPPSSSHFPLLTLFG